MLDWEQKQTNWQNEEETQEDNQGQVKLINN